MKNNVFNTVITVKVLSIDDNNKKVSLRVKFGDSKYYTIDNANISGLLVWKFRNDDNYEVGKVYSCLISDVDWRLMPFQLIVWGTKEHPCYLLECVNVRKSTKIVSKDVFGNELIDYKNNYYKSNQYRRYRNYVDMVKS